MRTYGQGYYLTREEEKALDKMRPLVEDDALLPAERRDNFLIKFLRARNLDVEAAAEMFKAAMQWRRERDLDKLLNTDYARWEKLFPFILSGIDKQGGPIFYVLATAYDVRKAIIAGHYQTLIDLFDRSFELAVRSGLAIFETSGQNPALSGLLILDLGGFNLRQHACARCLAVYVHVVTAYERYWPQVVHKVLMINTPRTFEVVLQVIKPLMSAHTANALEVYGLDRTEWEPVLKKYIDDDQLLVRYGGTRTITTLTTQTFGG